MHYKNIVSFIPEIEYSKRTLIIHFFSLHDFCSRSYDYIQYGHPGL